MCFETYRYWANIHYQKIRKKNKLIDQTSLGVSLKEQIKEIDFNDVLDVFKLSFEISKQQPVGAN